ncbi:(deoxy)nucleoside triphosphate pyrophosphohydrolase [Sphingomonas immobilis]|uniref:8-oxo-dGTP diphosphatase n=1 Tax=Sphingomonas immobilis TaxID=3063997 RepID=A0ABT9A2M7_9SPHN|nr:(deoxy)nucleoside triphosphate pyrophosphohydrolase [Sphingomonas sp. CA1-15]MDO7842977.1 (deoxy)nucleoside triphosphate pyrophosphohydrolase [Sphingomonas sp. CA1-15]
MLVVAAALIDADARVLVQQRPPGKALSGLWEYPGGKVEPGETPEAALVRELAEELGIAVAPGDLVPVTFATGPADAREMILLLYACRRWQGVPQMLDAAALAWCDVAELKTLPMPPADVRFAEAIAALCL